MGRRRKLLLSSLAAGSASGAPSSSSHGQLQAPAALELSAYGAYSRSLWNRTDGAWTRELTMEDIYANDTLGSIRRSAARLSVGQEPTAEDLCAFGRSMPRSFHTIVISGDNRRSRAHNAIADMCLPNARLVPGQAPFKTEAQVPPEERAKFGEGAFASLTLGEIAIHVSHRRGLDACLEALGEEDGEFPERGQDEPACLIMEDDFRLTGPHLAQRWRAAYAALQAEPEWHFAFVGRCLDARCGRGELKVREDADLFKIPQRTAAVGSDGWQYASPMCLHSYLVTREGAKRMNRALSTCPGLCPADWAPAVMLDNSSLYTISPALFTQSTALRLHQDTGATYSQGDLDRGVAKQVGNTWRPAMVSECMQRASDDPVHPSSLPESTQAPWFRASGGGLAPQLNTAVQWSYMGYQNAPPPADLIRLAAGAESSLAALPATDAAADAATSTHHLWNLKNVTASLTACSGLRDKLTRGAAREFFLDGAWQPGPEAVDAHMQGCALQYVASLDATHNVCGEARHGIAEYLFRRSTPKTPLHTQTLLHELWPMQQVATATDPSRCPFSSPNAPLPGAVSSSLNRLHCVAKMSGYIVEEDLSFQHSAKWHGASPMPKSDDEVRFQESAGWPRPATCGWSVAPRLDYRERAEMGFRPALVKMVNHQRKVEFRPMLKAGSTVLRHLLECLQPSEWKFVHQATRMPTSYTALVVVREPFRRWASAFTEILRRAFTGVCPDGPCENPRDFYFTHGIHDTADDLARHSSWYRHALRLFNGNVPPEERESAVRDLLAAAVTDTSCLLDYYGAEHFMTQSQLASQGTRLDAKGKPERALLLKLEDIGHTAESIASSPFLEAVGANTTADELQRCVAVAHAAAYNTEEAGSAGAAALAADAARKAASHADAPAASTPLTATVSKLALSNSSISGYRALPSENEIFEALHRDHGLLVTLCHVYAQDSLCLAAQYTPPPLCRELLAW